MWNSYHVRCLLLISWGIGHKLKCLQESERELWSISIHDLCQLSVCCLSALNPPFLLLPGHTGPFLLTSPLPTGTMLNFVRGDTWGTVQEEKASLPGVSLLFFVLLLLHVWQAAVSGHSMELILQHVFTSTPVGGFCVSLVGNPAGGFLYPALFLALQQTSFLLNMPWPYPNQ